MTFTEETMLERARLRGIEAQRGTTELIANAADDIVKLRRCLRRFAPEVVLAQAPRVDGREKP